MANNNNNSAATAAELLTAYNDAVTAKGVLSQQATEQEIEAADALIEENKVLYNEALLKEEDAKDVKDPKEKKEKKLKVRALLPLAGKFLLSYDPGQVFSIAENQANEIVEAKYGEFVK
jgi:uncharacterized membrane protein